MSLPLNTICRSATATASRIRMTMRAVPVKRAVHPNRVAKAYFSNSITYSGGQATEGQGGYYGSGGARAAENRGTHLSSEEERSKMLAMATDVQKIERIMEELESLEHILEREETENPGQVSGKSIEIKNSIKKLMTSPEVTEALNRLTLNGSPVWGLSTRERELIIAAREKVNEC